MIVIVGFCMAVIAYVLWSGNDTETARTAISSAFLTIGASLGSYVFGATWQHINTAGGGQASR
jgi:hypothetical protein